MSKPKSILPEDYLEKRIARRTNVICLSLFFIVMVGVVATLFVTDRQWEDIYARRDEVNQAYKNADVQIQQLATLQEQRERMVNKSRVADALKERALRSRILAELVNHMPRTVSWLEFELETEIARTQGRSRTALQRQREQQQANDAQQGEGDDAVVIEIPQATVTISLVGLAPSDVEVSEFMNALDQHELFSGVNLRYTESTVVDEQERRKFELEMTVNHNIDLTELQPMLVPRGLSQDPMGDDELVIDPSSATRNK